LANRNRVKASPKKSRSAKPGRAAPKDSSALDSAYAGIKAVRELRSGFGSYEVPAAVNDLLRRGWVLLGAGFVTQSGADGREFLYVLGTTETIFADDSLAASGDYAEMEAFIRSVGTDVDEA
jgi:hypothetical protein